MPQAWAARIKEPYVPGKVRPSDVVYIMDANSTTSESNVILDKSRSHGCCNKCLTRCKKTLCPLWCVALTIGILVLILLLAFGISFGLTYEKWRKEAEANKGPVTTTTATTTLKPRKDCKNFAIWNVETDECECREFTFGEFCENVTPCDELPDDPEECEYLAEIPDVDKEAFAAFCPKTARCSTKSKNNYVVNKCENYGLYDYEKSTCICLPHFFGEHCENVKDCKEMRSDPVQCQLFENIFKQHITSYRAQCPKSYFCSSTTEIL